jgi:iron complex outermembrane recepter protein
MKSINILGIIFLFISHAVFSQITLSGKITDKTDGSALIGATIYIPDLKTGALTDISGFYKIENLPKTKVLVQVSFLGYKTIAISIDLKTISTMDFKMEETVAEVGGVVITGTSNATEIKKNPVSMVTIDRKSIDQNASTNIIDAIANLPGVNAVTTSPNVSKPFIHGLGYNRVLTMCDGIRQEEQQWGEEHGVEVDEYSIDRIEVVKGPASLIYGSDALAGVVNLIIALPVTNNTIKGSLLAEYQTNNGLLGGSASLAGNKNGLVWAGRISHKQAADYQNKFDGRVYGTAYNETDVNGYIGLTKKWGYSHLKFSLFDDRPEIPDGSRDSASRKFTKQIMEADTIRPIVSNLELKSYKITTLHQHVQHYRVYLLNNFILGSGKMSVNLCWQQSDHREYSHPQAASVPGLYLVLNSLTYDIKYSLPSIKNWEITLGLNGMYQTNVNKGTEYIIPDYILFDAGPFIHIKKTFKKVELSAGVRYDIRWFNSYGMYTGTNPATGFNQQVPLPDTAGTLHPFSNYTHTFSGVSGSLGASYNISSKFIIKANISNGFRAPNISEISANGVHPGTNIYQIGNSSFKPETSLQEDLGFFFSSKHTIAIIELFNNNISNYIFNQRLRNHLGKDSNYSSDIACYKFQQSRAELYGGEISLDIHPHPLDWLHFENEVSVIYAINKGGNNILINDSAKYLPLIPPLHWHSELRANVKKMFKYFSSFYAKIELDYFAKQNRVYLADNTETPTPGYALLGVGIGTDIINSKGKTLFSIDISADNITNAGYQSHLSRLKYFEPYPNNQTGRNGIFNMGTNVSFKLIVPFDFSKNKKD